MTGGSSTGAGRCAAALGAASCACAPAGERQEHRQRSLQCPGGGGRSGQTRERCSVCQNGSTRLPGDGAAMSTSITASATASAARRNRGAKDRRTRCPAHAVLRCPEPKGTNRRAAQRDRATLNVSTRRCANYAITRRRQVLDNLSRDLLKCHEIDCILYRNNTLWQACILCIEHLGFFASQI